MLISLSSLAACGESPAGTEMGANQAASADDVGADTSAPDVPMDAPDDAAEPDVPMDLGGDDVADTRVADTDVAEPLDAEPLDTDLEPDATTDTDLADAADATADADVPMISALAANRDRLLDAMGEGGGTDRCGAWEGLDPVQRGIFLTITDLLGNRSWLTHGPDGPMGRDGDDLAQALDHIVAVHAVRGTEEGCFLGQCCGGGDLHRIYLSADDALMAALRDEAVGLPEWEATRDLAGPHEPFTQSAETVNGQPRGQAHFFANPDDAVALERPGVEGVLDPNMVEIDIDYNFFHDSNPECDYLTTGGNMTGRQLYETLWSPLGTGASVEFEYLPTGCGG